MILTRDYHGTYASWSFGGSYGLCWDYFFYVKIWLKYWRRRKSGHIHAWNSTVLPNAFGLVLFLSLSLYFSGLYGRAKNANASASASITTSTRPIRVRVHGFFMATRPRPRPNASASYCILLRNRQIHGRDPMIPLDCMNVNGSTFFLVYNTYGFLNQCQVTLKSSWIVDSSKRNSRWEGYPTS